MSVHCTHCVLRRSSHRCPVSVDPSSSAKTQSVNARQVVCDSFRSYRDSEDVVAVQVVGRVRSDLLIALPRAQQRERLKVQAEGAHVCESLEKALDMNFSASKCLCLRILTIPTLPDGVHDVLQGSGVHRSGESPALDVGAVLGHRAAVLVHDEHAAGAEAAA